MAGLSAEHMTKLDGFLVIDPSLGITPFVWLKAVPIAPKADPGLRRSVTAAPFAAVIRQASFRIGSADGSKPDT